MMVLVRDPMSLIPDEMAISILSYCSLRDLGRSAQVNKNWNRLASDPQLWAAFLASAQIKMEEVPGNLKNIFDRILIANKQDLFGKLKEFSSKLNKNTQATFVLFYLNQNAKIVIRAGAVKKPGPFGILTKYTGEPNLIEHHIYRDRLIEKEPITIPKNEENSAEENTDPTLDQIVNKIFKNTPNCSMTKQLKIINNYQIEIEEWIPIGNKGIFDEVAGVFEQRFKDQQQARRAEENTCAYIALAVAIVACVCFECCF